MTIDERTRLRLLARFEQLHAALLAGDSRAEAEARDILRRIISKGSCAILAQVFGGIISAWDRQNEEWERLA